MAMKLHIAWLEFYSSRPGFWPAADAILNAWPCVYDAWDAEA